MSTTVSEFPGWYIEFQAALLRQAPRPSEIDQTTAEGWTSNQKALKKNLASCLLPQGFVEPVKPEPLLELVGTVATSANTAKFLVKEKFVVNTKRNAPVKISYLDDNFIEWFLSEDSKTKDPIGEQALYYAKLRKASLDGPIITELGGEAKAETTLFEVFSLMEKQKNGEGGILLNNGYANIFYVWDGHDICTVCVRWYGDGWDVGAFSDEYLLGWDGGDLVFSRNVALESSEPVPVTN